MLFFFNCMLEFLWMIINDIVFFQQGKKTLILREIPDEVVGRLLSNKDALAACDVAVFVYDRYRTLLLQPLK